MSHIKLLNDGSISIEREKPGNHADELGKENQELALLLNATEKLQVLAKVRQGLGPRLFCRRIAHNLREPRSDRDKPERGRFAEPPSVKGYWQTHLLPPVRCIAEE